jgi:hypothetical protein
MRIVLDLTFVACLAASPAWGQQTEAPKSSVPALLSKLRSKNWWERSDAVDAIRLDTEALHSRKIQTALIDLLEQEYRKLDEGTGKAQAPNDRESNATGAEDDGEGYGEYLSWLAETVSSFADWNDTRQVCLLVSAATVIYPPSPTEAAIRARAAMPCILKRATDRQPINRDIAIPMLLEALAKGKDALDSKTVQNAKQIILNDLRDSDVGVRAGTVVALGNYGEIDMIPALQEIARSDPASEKTDNGGLWFPIRKSAIEAIAEIQQRARAAN